LIVHPAMTVYPDPKRVLIIGGGDGGTLREVLKHKEVEAAHICEIDGDVIRLCKKHFPKLARSFDDPRVEVFLEDGAQFIRERKNFYNVIIVDSSDPVGPAEVLFREEFYRMMSETLTRDGIVITQSESYLYHRDVIKNIVTFNRKIFPRYSYYYTMVPTYPSGVIGFSFCSMKYDPAADFNPAKADALKDLEYYSKDIHHASFILPNSFTQFLKSI
jgi:spermidine synthase